MPLKQGLPYVPNRRRVEIALACQPLFLQQALCPVTQRATQPAINKHAEAGLRTLKQLFRNVAAQQSPQHQLATSVLELQRQRQSPRKLKNPVIEEGSAHFEGNRHA